MDMCLTSMNKMMTENMWLLLKVPIDAIAIDGVALLGSEVKEQQTALLNSLGKHVIVVPDRDEAGQKLVHDSIEAGWSVSMSRSPRC